jgi:hypothetical protein
LFLNKNPYFIFGALILLFSLPACQASAQITPQPLITPQATATFSPTNTPTSVVSAQPALADYTHSSNRFRLKYPQNWQTHERADGVIILEPTDQAGYSVVFSDVGQVYSPQELNQYLVTFVAKNFAGRGSGFKAIRQEAQADGSIVAQFSSLDPNLGRAVSELRVFQQDSLVFVLHFSATEEQWSGSYPALQKLMSSFTPLDTSPAATPTAAAEPPTWALIGPHNKTFGFFYATNWGVVAQGENSVTVKEPTLNMTFTANTFSWPGADNDPKAAEKAALAHLEELSRQFEDMQSLPPTEFPLGGEAGSTIDFFYVDEAGLSFAGSVITAAHKGKMYKIVFSAPAEPVELYDAALQWFNPMVKSFKFLAPEEFVDEESSQ